jgi:hypothetical protein
MPCMPALMQFRALKIVMNDGDGYVQHLWEYLPIFKCSRKESWSILHLRTGLVVQMPELVGSSAKAAKYVELMFTKPYMVY